MVSRAEVRANAGMDSELGLVQKVEEAEEEDKGCNFSC